MYISAFHIDGFGVFSNVSVEGLKPGLSVFYGANEAGKSTCLEFLRAMLTGYPEKHKKAAERRFAPLAKNATAGGSITLITGEDGEELRLTRRPGKPLSLFAADGAPLSPSRLELVFRGVTQEVYRKVFGFSLGELETFESLSAEEVRNALYGASFGAGVQSPALVLKSLKAQKEAIFKGMGRNQPLNVTLRELEDLRATIATLREKSAEFDALSAERDRSAAKLKELNEKKIGLEKERRELERRLGVWLQWDKWRVLEARAEKLGSARENFPENARDTAIRLTDEKNIYESHLASKNEKLRLLKQTRDELPVDENLIAATPELKRVAERKNGFRQASGRLQALREGAERAREDLDNCLAQLGPGWDCDRVRGVDRSLFAREDMEKRAREMNEAMAAHQASIDYLSRANKEVEERERALKSARESLENLPEPDAELSERDRDELRRDMARLEESRRLAPARQRAFDISLRAFSRALEQIHFKLPKPWEDANLLECAEKVQGVLKRQDEALALAEDLRSRADEAAQASAAENVANERHEAIKRKIDEALAAQRSKQGPNREALETKAKALRNLRTLAANIDTEEERIRDLNARLDAFKRSSGFKNWLFIGLAILLFIFSLVELYAAWSRGASSIILGSLTVPVNPWLGFGALFCAFVCLAAGLPGYGAERRQYKLELERLRSRKESCESRLSELKSRAEEARAQADVESQDPITIEAAEMLLERERERCFHEERSRQETVELNKELAEAKEALEKARSLARERESEVQLYRHKWHNLMQDMNLSFVPSPESAPAIFARADAALVAYENVFNARKEQDALWEDLHLLEQNVLSMDAIKQRLENSPETLSLEEAVKITLENCRDADLLRDKKIRLQTSAQSLEEELKRSQENQKEASTQLRKDGERLESARGDWAEALNRFGLDANLTPETAREAFKYMENCLNAEERLNRNRKDLELCDAEIKGFREPLRSLAEKLGRPPLLGSDNLPDWLATIDALMSDAEKAVAAQSERERLTRQIDDEETGVNGDLAAVANIEESLAELFARAGAKDADDLTRLARDQDERLDIARQKAEIEASLTVAATGAPLADFLAKFDETDKDTQESRLEELTGELEKIDEETRATAANVGALTVRVNALATEEELAKLRQRETMLEEKVREMAGEWTKLSLAEQLTLRAKNIFESERQPEVIRVASGLFAQITGNRWRGISASLENSSLLVLPPHGEPIAPELLSRGAQEQAYLSLRLAYILDHARGATSLPVIMDEILVNFDPERAERAARAFANLGAGQQIFYFTCQPHMVELLKKACPGAPLYNVANHNIMAA